MKKPSLPEATFTIREALIERGLPSTFDAAVILGSGLGGFSNSLEVEAEIPYHEIPGLPKTSVVGHAGSLIHGKAGDQDILAFSGRFHFYEGHPFETTIIPVQIAAAFETPLLIVSNAAGAVNASFAIGDLMLIEDVLHLGHTLLPAGSQRFSYDHYQTVRQAQDAAAEIGIMVQRGTYLYSKGPNYETKAEIRAFRYLGADAVGMSTAPELFEAARLGMKAQAISLITNMASGISKLKLHHDEIKVAADSRSADFSRLVHHLIDRL